MRNEKLLASDITAGRLHETNKKKKQLKADHETHANGDSSFFEQFNDLFRTPCNARNKLAMLNVNIVFDFLS